MVWAGPFSNINKPKKNAYESQCQLNMVGFPDAGMVYQKVIQLNEDILMLWRSLHTTIQM